MKQNIQEKLKENKNLGATKIWGDNNIK